MNKHSKPFKTASSLLFDWQPSKRLTNLQLPLVKKDWLLDQGSLTERLTQLSEGHFRVKLVSQSVAKPRLDESRALGLKTTQMAVIREVVLQGGQEDWVFARSVIPLSSLKGKLRHLHYLNNQSLGSKLFQDPNLKRSQFEVYHQKSINSSNIGKSDEKTAYWGRRSVFHLYNQPLLVAEIFLPSFESRVSNTSAKTAASRLITNHS